MMTENMKALDMGVNYLEHHGILGQKWGIRRFQNEDGTWTKEGLERRRETALAYDAKNGKFDTSTLETNADIDALARSISEADGIVGKYDRSNSESRKKWYKSAELGLKAMNYKSEELGFYDDYDPSDRDWQFWFLYEDQTLGYPEAAVLMDNGYPASFVKSLFNQIDSLPVSSYGDDGISDFASGLIFAGKEGYKMDEFIDACEQVLIEEGRR